MTTCIMEQCLEAFQTKLESIPDVTVLRNSGLKIVEFPTLNMIDGGQKPDNATTQNKTYDLIVDVECWVDADNDDAIGSAKSALYAKLVSVVLTDITLGGVAIDVLESEMLDPIIDRREGAKPHISFSQTFVIRYSTAGDDPYSLGF